MAGEIPPLLYPEEPKSMKQLLQAGIITSPHGIHGEVKVYPTTDDPARFRELKTAVLKNGAKSEQHGLESVKFFKNMAIIHFSGIDDMDTAQKYRNWEVMVTREQAVPLGENEYYTADLIGMDVTTEEGEYLGTLTDILQTGANDVYIVGTERYGDVLIPAIRDCIIQVDVPGSRMTVHLLPGLAEEKK